MGDEIIIRTRHGKPAPPGVIMCPRCGGHGRNAAGMLSISHDEVRYRPGSKCFMCAGSGRVRVEPHAE